MTVDNPAIFSMTCDTCCSRNRKEKISSYPTNWTTESWISQGILLFRLQKNFSDLSRQSAVHLNKS